MTTRATGDGQTVRPELHRDGTLKGTETKAAFKTTEFIVFLVAVAAVLIAGLVVDGFNATETWMFFTYLAIGYMVSRGLAKSGSRNPRAEGE
jgi:hypothetical protein